MKRNKSRNKKSSRKATQKINQKNAEELGIKKLELASSLFVLEQRFLLDGAMVATAADAVEQQDTSAAEQQAQADAQERANQDALAISELNENYQASNDQSAIIFIDGSVANIATLLAEVDPAAEVHILDQNSDGVEQIAAILQDRTDIDAIHILSHGEEGEVALGNGVLNLQSMQGEHTDELAIIKNALSENGDILIYGCDLAGNAEGKQFVETLAELTGADVAASVDDTGAAQFGANWDLEHQTGEVTTQALAITAFAGILADTDGDGVDDANDIDDDLSLIHI